MVGLEQEDPKGLHSENGNKTGSSGTQTEYLIEANDHKGWKKSHQCRPAGALELGKADCLHVQIYSSRIIFPLYLNLEPKKSRHLRVGLLLRKGKGNLPVTQVPLCKRFWQKGWGRRNSDVCRWVETQALLWHAGARMSLKKKKTGLDTAWQCPHSFWS